MVICLEQGADLHTAQLMPLPLTVSCFIEIQIGFTFLVLAHPGSPGQRAVKRCVCVLQGVTFYDQLLSKLQSTYEFTVDDYVSSDTKGVRRSASRIVRLALVSSQRTMICLGDLARYREQASRTSNYGHARR